MHAGALEGEGLVLNLWVHYEDFSRHDVVINQAWLPGLQLGDLLEIRPADQKAAAPSAGGGGRGGGDGQPASQEARGGSLKDKLILQVCAIDPVAKQPQLQARCTPPGLAAERRLRTADEPPQQISIAQHIATLFGLVARANVIVRKIDKDAIKATHVEISFRDQYIGRSDMWRLKMALTGTSVHCGEKVSTLGVRGQVKDIIVDEVSSRCGYVADTTRYIFRSETAKYFIFIQMSKEMWDFDEDGELFFEKCINGFLPELFSKWKEINTNHVVSIILFSRVLGAGLGGLDLRAGREPVPVSLSCTGEPCRDFYRVVIDRETRSDWSQVLVPLKKEIVRFQQDMRSDMSGTTAKIAPTSEGNILEAINLALNPFDKHYVDRDLMRTGLSIVVVTPGTGYYEVNKKLCRLTWQRMIDNGVGLDLVCLSKPPLYTVPMFQFASYEVGGRGAGHNPVHGFATHMPRNSPSSAGVEIAGGSATMSSGLTTIGTASGPGGGAALATGGIASGPSGLPVISEVESDRRSTHTSNSIGRSDRHYHNDSAYVSKSAGSERRVEIWDPLYNDDDPLSDARLSSFFTIPNWVDCSFWSRSSPSSVVLASASTPAFVSRCRMTELQNTGIDQSNLKISVPYLDLSSSALEIFGVTHGAANDNRDNRLPASIVSELANYDDQVFSRLPDLHIDVRGPLLAEARDPIDSPIEEDRVRLLHPKSKPSTEAIPLLARRGNVEPEPAHGLPEAIMSRSHNDRYGYVAQHMQMQPPRAISATPTSAAPISKLRGPAQAPALAAATGAGIGVGIGAGIPQQVARAELGRPSSQLSSSLKSRDLHRRLDLDSGVEAGGLVGAPGSDASLPMQIRVAASRQAALGVTAADKAPPSASALTRNSYSETASTRAGSSPGHDMGRILSRHSPSIGLHAPANRAILRQNYVNPCNPANNVIRMSSQARRWEHIFPRVVSPVRDSNLTNWKSLCTPACLPLTTEFFPSDDELQKLYEDYVDVVEPADDPATSDPSKIESLLIELISHRLSQGFQLVVRTHDGSGKAPAAGAPLALGPSGLPGVVMPAVPGGGLGSLPGISGPLLPPSGSFLTRAESALSTQSSGTLSQIPLPPGPLAVPLNAGDAGLADPRRSRLSMAPGRMRTATQENLYQPKFTLPTYQFYDLSLGDLAHRLSLEPSGGKIRIQRYNRRIGYDTENINYSCEIWAKHMTGYTTQKVCFSYPTIGIYKWNYLDNLVAGHENEMTDPLKYWRARFLLIPAESVMPVGGLSGGSSDTLTEEESRIAGLRKFLDVVERARWTPPSEVTPQSKKVKRQIDVLPITDDVSNHVRNEVLKPADSEPSRSPVLTVIAPGAPAAASSAAVGALTTRGALDAGAPDVGEAGYIHGLADVTTALAIEGLLSPAADRMSRSSSLLEIALKMQHPSGPAFKNRRWHFTVFENVCVGTEFVDWLLRTFADIDSRDDAIEFGNYLLDKGVLVHVYQRHRFMDGFYFYAIGKEFGIDVLRERLASQARRNPRTPGGPSSSNTALGSSPQPSAVLSLGSAQPASAKAGVVADRPDAAAAAGETFALPASSLFVQESAGHASRAETLPRPQSALAPGAPPEKFMLTKQMQIDMDPLRKSTRPERAVLHYDTTHNTRNCYHIRLHWLVCTPRLIEDMLESWARAAEKYSLKLVEAPVDQAQLFSDDNPFQSVVPIPLAVRPPRIPELRERLRAEVDVTPFWFESELLRSQSFVLDLEADHLFPENSVGHSHQRSPFHRTQFVHRSGVAFVQICDDGRFLWVDNRVFLSSNKGSASQRTASQRTAAATPSADPLREELQRLCSDRDFLTRFWADAEARLVHAPRPQH